MNPEIELFSELKWLPRTAGIADRCTEILQGNDACGSQLRQLATYSLNETQLRRLATTVKRLREQDRSFEPLVPFKLGIIGNGTLDLIGPAIVGSALRHGLVVECVNVPYGAAVEQVMVADSALNMAACDAVLIAMDYHGLPLRPNVVDREDALRSLDESIALIETLRNGIHSAGRALCIVQTVAPPVETVLGSLDRKMAGSTRQLLAAFNAWLSEELDGGDVIFDVAALAETVGLAAWHSPAQWNIAKLPFDNNFLPLYGEHAARLLGALRGKSRRCLILDLDNTLWGGVVGDDGVEKLVLGEGDATGEAFLSVQRLAASLRDRGIVLAVSSKNDADNARRAFREHPGMVLKEDDIAVFKANWQDKATNIRAIAEELSLGLDAMVFLDDNPVERGLVRKFLPEVAVPELPEDAALYARTLSAAGYFEAVTLSKEDAQRAEFYKANIRRSKAVAASLNLADYLASLRMELIVQPFDAMGRARIAQLIAKSNQFNLTTRRYDEAEIAALETESGALTLQMRLTDIHGDNGMISVVICRPTDIDVWEIDTWLMSCRVLSRGVEKAVLAEIVHHAGLRGIHTLRGVYRATPRNAMVSNHYANLGFSPLVTSSSTQTEWSLRVSDVPLKEGPIHICRVNFPSLVKQFVPA